MHNIKSNFDKVLQTNKSLNFSDFKADDNILKPGISSLISDIEVMSLIIVAEYMSLDSENWFLRKLIMFIPKTFLV